MYEQRWGNYASTKNRWKPENTRYSRRRTNTWRLSSGSLKRYGSVGTGETYPNTVADGRTPGLVGNITQNTYGTSLKLHSPFSNSWSHLGLAWTSVLLTQKGVVRKEMGHKHNTAILLLGHRNTKGYWWALLTVWLNRQCSVIQIMAPRLSYKQIRPTKDLERIFISGSLV